MEVDKENFKLLQAIRNERETELNFSSPGYEVPGRIHYSPLDYVEDCLNRKLIINGMSEHSPRLIRGRQANDF